MIKKDGTWQSGYLRNIVKKPSRYFLKHGNIWRSFVGVDEREYYKKRADFKPSQIFLKLDAPPAEAPAIGSVVRTQRILAYYGDSKSPYTVSFNESTRQFAVTRLSELLNPPLPPAPVPPKENLSSGRRSDHKQRTGITLVAATAAGVVGLAIGQALTTSPESPAADDAPQESIVSTPPVVTPPQEPPMPPRPPTEDAPAILVAQEGNMAKSLLLDIRRSSAALAQMHASSDAGMAYAELSVLAQKVLPEVDLYHDLSARTLELMQEVREYIDDIMPHLERDLHRAANSDNVRESQELYKAYRGLDRVIRE